VAITTHDINIRRQTILLAPCSPDITTLDIFLWECAKRMFT